MQKKVVSTLICAMMILSGSVYITQDVGEPEIVGEPENVGQSQNNEQPNPTSGGSGGLADSPWPMFRQNLKHTGVSPYDTSANNGSLKWSFTTGDVVRSPPIIGIDGTIYVGSYDSNLYAINPDGTQKWSFNTGNWVYSSPAISSDCTIYVGSFGAPDGKLYAINPDGTEKWHFIMPGQDVTSSPAIGTDGTIYIGSENGNLYAFNPNGTEKWSFFTSGAVRSSPSISPNSTIYVGAGEYFYAINPDGSQKWSFSGSADGFTSSAAISSDGTIYVGSYESVNPMNSRGKVYAINPDGTEKWSFPTEAGIEWASPAIGSDGTIYIGSFDKKLWAINPDGTEKWNFTTGDIIDSSPAIGSDGTIYVGSSDHILYAINQNGTEKWNFPTYGYVRSSPAIDSDGTIYVGSGDGKLYAIGNPTPNLEVSVTSHFSDLNSAAQSAITIHVTDGTNPVQGATVNLDSDNGGIFSPQSGITDANGDFESIFNAPTVTSQIICRISAEASKTSYNNGYGYVDVTINPIPWPMFRHNPRHTGLSPYDASSNNGNLKWIFKTGGPVWSSPSIDIDGTIYVGSDDKKLYAINPDGTEKWRFTTGGIVISSPAICSDGTIYVGSYDHNLYAINPDGSEKWRFNSGSEIFSSPVIGADGTIYFGCNRYYLYAINPDGSEKWRFNTTNWVTTSPAIGYDGTIYVGHTHKKFFAINPDGTEKWSFTTGGHVYPSASIDIDGTIYVGSDAHKLHSFNPDGTEKWGFSIKGSTHSTAAISQDGTIYFGTNIGKLYALNPDGTENWNFSTGSTVMSSPGIGSNGTIFFGSRSNKLYAFKPTGHMKWEFSAGDNVDSSPAIGSDGTIYVGSRDGNLYAIGGPTENLPPVADAGPDQTIYEGDLAYFDSSNSYDPDGTIEFYEWDFDSSDGLWWETGAVPDATDPTASQIYGDDGIYTATLRVTDNDNLSATDTCNVTVQNVNPTVTIESITMNVEVGLRVAGRKYNNVSMALYEDGSQLGYVSIERMPGSPDEQIAWIPVSINFSKSYNATVTYTPKDPPNVGGNPVWIYIKSKDGSINKIHHTFNVQQSKKRDSEHWNHVEPWEVDLNGHFIGLPFEITSHITDPGSDDETLTFTYGSQVKTVTYLNNPPNPDPYPSPEVNPRDIFGITTLVYEGPGTITLIAKDDDNIRLGIGQASDSIGIG